MLQQFQLVVAFLGILGNIALVSEAKAGINSDLTITVDGLKKPQGQICFSIFAKSKGFPGKKDSSLQAGCVKVAQTSLEL